MSAAPAGKVAGYALAFGAAFAYGAAAVLIRRGTTRFGSPFTGVTIALCTGLIVVAPLAWRAYRRQPGSRRLERTAVLFVLASGLTSLFGFSANVIALSKLPVVIVTPISSAYPLITVLLVRLFLHGHEQITRRTVLGAVSIVAGIVLVTLSRNR